MQQHLPISVIIASETGTAVDLAKQFICSMHVNSVSTFDSISSFSKESLWIFFISTTGQGSPPRSMQAFWAKLIKKSFSSLKGVKFAVYGLGDTSYGENYNLMSRKFRQRMLMLNAEEVVEIGLGNDQDKLGYRQSYSETWFPKLVNFLKQSFPQTLSMKPSSQMLATLYARPACRLVKITNRKEICTNKRRRTYLIELQHQEPVHMGDTLVTYPQNNPQNLDFMLKYYQTENVTANSLEELNLSNQLNYTFFLEIPDHKPLSEFTDVPQFSEKLGQIASDFQEYFYYIRKFKRNIVEVIRDFELAIPFHQLKSRINRIAPRKYSIADVNEDHPNQFGILIRLLQREINSNRVHKGTCTHNLAVWADIGQCRQSYFEKSQFTFQEKNQNYVILIAVGTGIAPFLPLLKKATKSAKTYHILVFYTNQYKNELYGAETLEELKLQGKLQSFITFTRQETGEKVKRIPQYLQENTALLREYSEKAGESLKVMICGPTELYEHCVRVLCESWSTNEKEMVKKRILEYQNW